MPEIVAHELLTGADRLMKAKEIDHSNLPVNEEKNSRNTENTEEARSTPRNYSLFSLAPKGTPSVSSVLRCYCVKG
jgi:hypothetical protein